MSAGERPAGQRTGKIVASGGVAAFLLLKAGTNAGEVDVNGAGDWPVGVSQEKQPTQNEYVEYATAGVTSVTASAAINKLTSGKPTRLVPAANGKVAAKPTSGGGTAVVIGEVDVDSDGASGDGVLLQAKLYGAPREEAIPA